MKVVLVAITVFGAIVVNALAIVRSRRGATKAHRFARVAGLAGLVSFVLLLAAFLDLFSQIWVARPGYSGWPVGISAGLAVTSSIASIAALVWLSGRSSRATADPP